MAQPFEQSPSPEDAELKALLDEAALAVGPRMEAALAQKDASLAALTIIENAESVPLGSEEPELVAVAGATVHDRFSQTHNKTKDLDGQQVKGRRRGKSTPPAKLKRAKKVQPEPIVLPESRVPSEQSAAHTEAEPFPEGKYRDHKGILCQLFKQGNDYWYKVLEGEDEGGLVSVGDEKRLRLLMGDEWHKVDDATEPVLAVTTPEDTSAPQAVKDGLKLEGERKNEFVFASTELSLASPEHPESNQDRVLNLPKMGIFGVFDGMGGYVGGERAAEIAQQSVEKFITNHGEQAQSLEEAKDILRNAILVAHNDIMAAKAGDKKLREMGTTATVGLMFEGKLIVGSVGDSRLYRVRQGTLAQLSVDDSSIPEELRAKFNNVVDPQTELDDYERAVWGMRNMITKALGTDSFQEPMIEVFDVVEGDQYLFTSDGLTDPITDNELSAALSSESTSSQLLTEVAERARKGGERTMKDKKEGIKNTSRDKTDDISFVLVRVESKGEGVRDNTGTANEKSKQDDFLPSQIGQQISFVGKEGPVVVERAMDGYRLLTQTGVIIGEGYDEEHIRNIAREESWKSLDSIPVLPESDAIEEPVPTTLSTPADAPVLPSESVSPSQPEVNSDGWSEARLLAEFPEGSQFVLRSKKGRSQRTYERSGDGFVDTKKGTLVTTADILELVNNNGWTFAEESVVSVPKTPVAENDTEAEHIREEYQELFEGDIWVRKDEKGRVFKMHIDSLILDGGIYTADVEYEVNGKFKSLGIMRISDLRRRLFEEGYTRNKQGKISEKELVDARPPKELKEVPDDYIEDMKTPLEQRIEDLKDLVSTQRMEYVSTDHKQNSAWSKIRRLLPGISETPGDADTTMKRESYELALQKLKNAQIEELKKEGLSEGMLQERMAELLKFYEYDEQLELMKTRDQVKIEQLAIKVEGSLLEKAGREFGNELHLLVATAEKAGRWYNKQSRLTKYTLAGVSLGAGLMGGAAVAGGLVVVRRSLAAAGLAVTADTWLEGKSEAKRLAASKEKGAADMRDLQEMQNYNEDYLAKLDTLLNERIATLDDRFKIQKREKLFNRSAAWGVAVGGMLGGQFIASHWEDIKKVLPNMAPKMPMKELTDNLDQLKAAQEAGTTSVVETAPTGGLLKEYVVTDADGRRGFWGVLDKQLPEGFAGNRNSAIANLQRVIEEKLAGKSSAELKELGFGPKGMADIHPGATIDLPKLLTKEDIQSVLEEKVAVSEATPGAVDGTEKIVKVAEASSTAPEAAKVAVVSGTPLDVAANEAVFSKLAQKDMVPLNQAPDPMAAVREAVAEDRTRVAVVSSVEDPARLARSIDAADFFKEYFQANPEKISVFKQTLGNMRQAVFLTPELMGDNQFSAKFDYTINRGTMGLANMARVMENAGRLQTGMLNQSTLMQEQNPLHESQIRHLARLAQVAQDPQVFGELGRVGRYETVDQYTRRIATLATALNKERALVTLFAGAGRSYLKAA